MWLLGTRLEGVAVLHAGYHPSPGALAGKLAVPTVRGATFQGCGKDRHKTEGGESL